MTSKAKKTLLENWNAKVCKYSTKIKQISDLDVVVHGQPFSDVINEEEQREEEREDDDVDDDDDDDDDDADDDDDV